MIRASAALWVSFLLLSFAFPSVIPGRWDKLEHLSEGCPIIVSFHSGEVATGRFRQLDADSFELTGEAGNVRSVQKSEVLRVEIATDSNSDGVVKGVFIGGLIGGAVGGLFAAGFSDSLTAGEIVVGVALFGGLGAGVGAGVGYGVDKISRNREIVYSAR